MIPLATENDVVAAMGRGLTSKEQARYEAVLSKASELFRNASGQQFTPGRTEALVKVNGGIAYLTQGPVTEIHSVTDQAGHEVPYSRLKRRLTVPKASHEFIVVDYSHGENVVPDLVRLTVAEVVKKVLTVSEEAAEGVTQYSETQGPFTEAKTYATWAQGGQTILAPEDKAIAESFRFKTPNVIVMRP